jgi:integrase/recombinase XerD
MTEVQWSHFPLVAAYEHAHRWLQFTAHLGRAQNTIEAYGRAVDDHLPPSLSA